MENNDKRFFVEQIKTKYIDENHMHIDRLKYLDKKASRPARIFGWLFGIIGALVLGTGMSFAMKVIGDSMAMGIVIGLVGILMVCINYPIYKIILTAGKKKYADEIIRLSNRIIESLGEE